MYMFIVSTNDKINITYDDKYYIKLFRMYAILAALPKLYASLPASRTKNLFKIQISSTI